MNNARRKVIKNIISSLQTAQSELESIGGEEERYRDNMPENLIDSNKYTSSEEASENIDDALDSLNEALESLNAIY